ncbi:MAG TPA: permease-like cell division protein FtsX [Corynebacterium sp.]|nr:permease-like cell division protein FtsX [Corynebacterium sp.]
MNNIGYVLREGAAGLRRNLTMSIALIITTGISLALLGAGVLLSQMAGETKEIYLERVEVMVQLDETISATDADCASPACREVRDTLTAEPGVDSVIYRSREQSYERFVELFAASDPLLVQETSPAALPAAFHVRLSDPTDPAPVQVVAELPQVTAVIDQSQSVSGAAENLDAIRTAAFLLAGVQAVAALLLIVNMVQISAFQRREEISIMRLVGATRWFTQAPFLIEVCLATLLGAVLAVGGLFLGKTQVVDPALSQLYESRLIAEITAADIWAVMPWLSLGGVICAGLAAYLTLRLHGRR